MKRMKKIILAILLLSAILMGCASGKGRLPIRTDRIAYPWSQAMMIHAPGLELNTCLAELIAEVEICSDRQTDRYTLSGEVPVTVTGKRGGSVDGDAVDAQIRGGLDSGVTRLLENDELVLFLKIEAETGIYYLIDEEYSMFAVNPDGRCTLSRIWMNLPLTTGWRRMISGRKSSRSWITRRKWAGGKWDIGGEAGCIRNTCWANNFVPASDRRRGFFARWGENFCAVCGWTKGENGCIIKIRRKFVCL